MLTILNLWAHTGNPKLSQPNNNHDPNNKTTKTKVGLGLSNRWETTTHPLTTTQTQNYMIEHK